MMNMMNDQKDGGKSTKKPMIKPSCIKFADIFGHSLIKNDLQQIINFFNSPSTYASLGARLRRGVLLYGPSGTGKTMLAKALANEAKVNFLYRSATEFVEMYVGVGPRRIRDLFEEARKRSPCIIFIDEIDALGSRSTSSDPMGRTNEERNGTINQLLVEMDGFSETDRIVIIGATNREKHLDFALVRSGRFDLKFKVDLPSEAERLGILNIKLQKISWDGDQQTLEEVARATAGMSGADLDAVVNEAVYGSIDDGRMNVNSDDLKKATIKIVSNIINVQNAI